MTSGMIVDTAIITGGDFAEQGIEGRNAGTTISDINTVARAHVEKMEY